MAEQVMFLVGGWAIIWVTVGLWAGAFYTSFEDAPFNAREVLIYSLIGMLFIPITILGAVLLLRSARRYGWNAPFKDKVKESLDRVLKPHQNSPS